MTGNNSSGNGLSMNKSLDSTCRGIEMDSQMNAVLAAFNGIEDTIATIKPDHTVLWCNRSGYKLLGKRPDDVIGRKCFELVGRQNPCDNCVALAAISSRQIKIAERYVPELGRHFQRTASPIIDKDGNISLVILQVHDISSYKSTEEALRNSEESLKAIFETSPAGIILVDPKGRITIANRSMADLFACSIDDLHGVAYVDLLHPDLKAVGLANMKSLIAGEIDNVSIERRYMRKNGQEFWGHLSGRRLSHSDGKFLGLVGIITDITKRKKAEESHKESEARFKGIYEHSPIGIEIYDSLGRLIHINKACMYIFGVSNIEAIQGFSLFDDPNLPDYARESLLGGETVKYETAFDFEKVKKLGLYETAKSGIIYVYVLYFPTF